MTNTDSNINNNANSSNNTNTNSIINTITLLTSSPSPLTRMSTFKFISDKLEDLKQNKEILDETLKILVSSFVDSNNLFELKGLLKVLFELECKINNGDTSINIEDKKFYKLINNKKLSSELIPFLNKFYEVPSLIQFKMEMLNVKILVLNVLKLKHKDFNLSSSNKNNIKEFVNKFKGDRNLEVRNLVKDIINNDSNSSSISNSNNSNISNSNKLNINISSNSNSSKSNTNNSLNTNINTKNINNNTNNINSNSNNKNINSNSNSKNLNINNNSIASNSNNLNANNNINNLNNLNANNKIDEKYKILYKIQSNFQNVKLLTEINKNLNKNTGNSIEFESILPKKNFPKLFKERLEFYDKIFSEIEFENDGILLNSNVIDSNSNTIKIPHNQFHLLIQHLITGSVPVTKYLLNLLYLPAHFLMKEFREKQLIKEINNLFKNVIECGIYSKDYLISEFNIYKELNKDSKEFNKVRILLFNSVFDNLQNISINSSNNNSIIISNSNSDNISNSNLNNINSNLNNSNCNNLNSNINANNINENNNKIEINACNSNSNNLNDKIEINTTIINSDTINSSTNNSNVNNNLKEIQNLNLELKNLISNICESHNLNTNINNPNCNPNINCKFNSLKSFLKKQPANLSTKQNLKIILYFILENKCYLKINLIFPVRWILEELENLLLNNNNSISNKLELIKIIDWYLIELFSNTYLREVKFLDVLGEDSEFAKVYKERYLENNYNLKSNSNIIGVNVNSNTNTNANNTNTNNTNILNSNINTNILNSNTNNTNNNILNSNIKNKDSLDSSIKELESSILNLSIDRKKIKEFKLNKKNLEFVCEDFKSNLNTNNDSISNFNIESKNKIFFSENSTKNNQKILSTISEKISKQSLNFLKSLNLIELESFSNVIATFLCLKTEEFNKKYNTFIYTESFNDLEINSKIPDLLNIEKINIEDLELINDSLKFLFNLLRNNNFKLTLKSKYLILFHTFNISTILSFILNFNLKNNINLNNNLKIEEIINYSSFLTSSNSTTLLILTLSLNTNNIKNSDYLKLYKIRLNTLMFKYLDTNNINNKDIINIEVEKFLRRNNFKMINGYVRELIELVMKKL